MIFICKNCGKKVNSEAIYSNNSNNMCLKCYKRITKEEPKIKNPFEEIFGSLKRVRK